MDRLTDLRDELARTSDDVKRALLFDSIGAELARNGQEEEALAECIEGVEILERLEHSDAVVVRQLATCLSNLGTHLDSVGRFGDAIRAYGRSVEILSNMAQSEQADLCAQALNAERLGVILQHKLGQALLAAKFHSLALGLWDGLSEIAPEYIRRRDSQASVLLVSISWVLRGDDLPEYPETHYLDTLDLLNRPLFRVADYLDKWAQATFELGDRQHALHIALCLGIYFDMFPARPTDGRLESKRSHNAARIATWSADSAGVDPTLARLRSRADRRLWSCTGSQLSDLMRDLEQRGFPSSDAYVLADNFRATRLYPARDFPYRCIDRPPNVFITYTWSDNYVDLQVAVRSCLNYIGTLMLEARPDLDIDEVRDCVNERLGLWIDFIFIDQSSRHLSEEVRDVLPRILSEADVHFVLSDTALTRSWCCYELGLFNRPTTTVRSRDASLTSFIALSRSLKYDTYANTVAASPDDKEEIRRSILDLFPDGMHGFDVLLMQASLMSDRHFFKGFVQSTAAIDTVAQSIDKWLLLGSS